MKTWIKRSLIGLATTAVLLGGLAACSHHRHSGPMTDADVMQLREKVIERATRKLDLDTTQQAHLARLADAVKDQRAALLAGGTQPRAELQALVAGSSFDRTRAQALLDGKTQAVRDKAPAVITAFGNFYDALKPEQQQKLREMLARGRGRG